MRPSSYLIAAALLALPAVALAQEPVALADVEPAEHAVV